MERVNADIRRRSGDDLGQLRELSDEILQLDAYPPRRPRDLGEFVAAPNALASFVAARAGQVVGHVCVSPSSSPEVLDLATRVLGVEAAHLAVVARLLVSPAHRRQGIARALLGEALAETRRLGRTPILDVATHFHPAISLYEECGWRRAGRVTVGMGEMEPLDEYVYLGPLTRD